jgi:hypothetical protein
MTLQSKRGLIKRIRSVCQKASNRQKGQHLDHLELVTELTSPFKWRTPQGY